MNKIDHAVIHTVTTTTYFDRDGRVIDTVRTLDNHFVNYKLPVSDSVKENKYNEDEKGG